MDNVIRWLEESDFFTALASTKCPLLCLIQTDDSIASSILENDNW